MPTHYEVLGISRDATGLDIRQAYVRLVREHHPDKVSAERKAAAEETFKAIQSAYEVLSDSAKKAAYDNTLSGSEASAAASAAAPASPPPREESPEEFAERIAKKVAQGAAYNSPASFSAEALAAAAEKLEADMHEYRAAVAEALEGRWNSFYAYANKNPIAWQNPFPNKDYPIHTAIRQENVTAVKAALTGDSYGRSMDFKSADGLPTAHLAAVVSNSAAVDLLIGNAARDKSKTRGFGFVPDPLGCKVDVGRGVGTSTPFMAARHLHPELASNFDPDKPESDMGCVVC